LQEVFDEDDESDGCARPVGGQHMPLEKPEVAFDVSPLVAENPQRCFERYSQRLHDRLAGASETAWDRLQVKASEQILGGHVGKLEFFWIHKQGTEAAPETAEGLVCFQFVQGCAANFGRILHLSVVEHSQDSLHSWKDMLPSAIFQVRCFLFATLPVDSLRAVVLAGQDGSGPIYVDSEVEAAYQRCRFRWFQLTQSLHRTRSGLRLKKTKMKSRFLVLHTIRGAVDPPAPRSNIGCMPALLLRNNERSTDAGFSQW